jgi:hypothetical protein
MKIDDKLRREFDGLTAKEAAELVCNEFDEGYTSFRYILTSRKSCAKSILNLPGADRISAEEISPIEFWGGPPDRRQFYRGTLLTWVCDLVLHAWSTKGYYTDMVVDDKLQTA